MAAKKMTLKRRIRREKQRNRMIMHDNKDNSGGGLHSDIIKYDILTRVPIESLMRFRCVCKQWSKELIWDPLFVELHSRRSYNEPGFIIRPYGSTTFMFLDIVTKRGRDIGSPRRYYDFLDDDSIEILSSLNGLLLIFCSDEYFVCNPITGSCFKLPEVVWDAGITMTKPGPYFRLTYDSILAKYKVVCICKISGVCREYLCKILTLGVDDSWRNVAVPKPNNYYLNNLYGCPGPVFANGSLHMMMHIGKSGFNGILGLDVNREIFYTTTLPKYSFDGEIAGLLEMGGLLCFYHRVTQTNRLKLWVLKEEKDLENNDDSKEGDQWREECCIDMKPSEETKLPFPGFLDECYPFGILKHHKAVKLIFRNLTTDYFTYNSYKSEFDDECLPAKYYSYDMELKQLDYICEQDRRTPIYCHVNSLANF